MVFNHLWIINEKARKEYQEFCTAFNTLRPISLPGFDTPIDDEVFLKKVIAFCLCVKDRKNRIPVFLKPDLSPEGIRSYWRGQIQRPGKYLKLALKMDIEANGDVSPFKNFPDVSLGNIYESPIAEILTSDRYRQVSEYLLTNNLYIYHSCPDYYNLGLTQK
jgi:MoaA/NifB/PqqE/SkfB family radical SAM enzyme